MPTKTDDLKAQYPDAWIAVTEGDTLEGEVVEVTRAWSDARNRGQGDGWYPLLRIKTGDGVTLNFHAFSHVSYNEVMDKQPIPGEKIVITYAGEGKAKPGQNAPKIYRLTLPDRDPAVTARNVYSRIGNGAAQTVADTPVGTGAQPDQISTDDIPF